MCLSVHTCDEMVMKLGKKQMNAFEMIWAIYKKPIRKCFEQIYDDCLNLFSDISNEHMCIDQM